MMINIEQQAASELSEEQLTKINKIVVDLAKRLESSEIVEENIRQWKQSDGESVDNVESIISKELNIYLGLGLSGGMAGYCLLFGELDRFSPDDGWDLIGHQYMVQIQQKVQEQGISTFSLYSGLAGVGMAAFALSRQGTRYTSLITTVHNHIVANLPSFIKYLTNKLNQNDIKMNDYDAIEGAAGLGRYLLLYKEKPDIKEALEKVIQYVIRLSEFKEVNGKIVPGWHIRSENLFLASEREKFKNGNFNVGLAHGIPGPLAFLVLAKKEGIEVKGQVEAIERIVNWLLEWQREDEFGPIWPLTVSWEELIDGKLSKNNTYHREAWCYGSPGVARTIWLAGDVLERKSWKELAIESFKATFSRPMNQWHINTPNFCHGYIGLLQIAHRMYLDTRNNEILEGRNRLIDLVLDMYNPEFPFGYYDIRPWEGEETLIHNPGLLEGATGSALVLLSLINQNNSNWDSMFLIS
ncbi:lanthionine synthetase C family protein [Cytobacillus sp. IB215665]|uniref:lanthionine synthetase C family protein n=1 Tax=Cytobacillus sp. IB215665 TaxID=3097357 RepID=UPI002A0CD71F|nr:lanthionine synthetase C family protein [Cytobacillus sp. IB215665]MDX8365447.1 lanthionine synthetase C family protein [Cytobacillus sp. IB215665]